MRLVQSTSCQACVVFENRLAQYVEFHDVLHAGTDQYESDAFCHILRADCVIYRSINLAYVKSQPWWRRRTEPCLLVSGGSCPMTAIMWLCNTLELGRLAQRLIVLRKSGPAVLVKSRIAAFPSARVAYAL